METEPDGSVKAQANPEDPDIVPSAIPKEKERDLEGGIKDNNVEREAAYQRVLETVGCDLA